MSETDVLTFTDRCWLAAIVMFCVVCWLAVFNLIGVL